MSTILVKENELKALAFNKLTQAGSIQKQHSASNRFRLLSLFWTLMMEWGTAR